MNLNDYKAMETERIAVVERWKSLGLTVEFKVEKPHVKERKRLTREKKLKRIFNEEDINIF